jgi:hypothetical protein
MNLITDSNYSHQYLLDYSYSSFVSSLVRVTIDGLAYYFDKQLHALLEPSYTEDFEPSIAVVVEDSSTDTLMSWVFAKVGAEMLRVHFHNVYPPPGDQFLIRDGQGKVIFEYKWELGAEAMSPWVPGNTLYVDVVPQWQSIYGGVNHFYFTIDEMGVVDTEYVPPTDPTTTTSSPDETTLPLTTPTITEGSTNLELDPIVIVLGGFFCLSCALVFFYMKKR